ncbi:MAG: YceI family protein [Phycisphaeraceae bacterium]|nr:YceI family protein [Phycisphaerales bacterium]MCB9859196.1 YceI family protein [Phycisphaeraceae bacterium]
MDIRKVALGLILAGAAGVGVSVLSGFGISDAPKMEITSVSDFSNKAVYKVDGVHSSLVFSIRHNGVSNFMGQFNGISGTFVAVPETNQVATVEVSIKADSVNTGNEGRNNHLKGGDFFSAKEFPEITFKGSGSAFADSKGKIRGDLTMLGVTKPIEAEAEFIGTGESRGKKIAGFQVKFEIKRSDFGMNYGIANNALGDSVTITASFEGAEQEGEGR